MAGKLPYGLRNQLNRAYAEGRAAPVIGSINPHPPKSPAYIAHGLGELGWARDSTPHSSPSGPVPLADFDNTRRIGANGELGGTLRLANYSGTAQATAKSLQSLLGTGSDRVESSAFTAGQTGQFQVIVDDIAPADGGILWPDYCAFIAKLRWNLTAGYNVQVMLCHLPTFNVVNRAFRFDKIYKAPDGWGAIVIPKTIGGAEIRYRTWEVNSAGTNPGNWANKIRSLAIIVHGQDIYPQDVLVDAVLDMSRGQQKGRIAITWDDANDDCYDAWTYVQSVNPAIKMTHFVIPSALDTVNGLSVAEMLEMQAAGDLIGVHDSLIWAASASFATPELALVEMQARKAELIAVGHATSFSHFKTSLEETKVGGLPFYACRSENIFFFF